MIRLLIVLLILLKMSFSFSQLKVLHINIDGNTQYNILDFYLFSDSLNTPENENESLQLIRMAGVGNETSPNNFEVVEKVVKQSAINLKDVKPNLSDTIVQINLNVFIRDSENNEQKYVILGYENIVSYLENIKPLITTMNDEEINNWFVNIQSSILLEQELFRERQ